MEGSPPGNDPRNIFEMFPRSLGGVSLILSWILVYCYVLTPWDEASRKIPHVVYSITALGLTTAATLASGVLVFGGGTGARLLTNCAPSRAGWKQGLFLFLWVLGTTATYWLLEQHFRAHGYRN